MASKHDVSRANRILELIKKNGSIHRYDLQDLMGMSGSAFNNLMGWFRYRYETTLHQIEYDQKSKMFRWCQIQKIEVMENEGNPKGETQPGN